MSSQKIVLQRKDRKLIENIFEHPDDIFSIKFINYEDTIWCKSISEIYIALEQFKKNGVIKTDEMVSYYIKNKIGADSQRPNQNLLLKTTT